MHGSTQRDHPIQRAAVSLFRESMLKKLAKKPWIAEHRLSLAFGSGSPLTLIELAVIPDFPVACRRLTPGPGYLEALCEDNVNEFHIQKFQFCEHKFSGRFYT